MHGRTKEKENDEKTMVHSEFNTGVEVTLKTGVFKHLRNTAEESASLTQ